MIIYDYFSRIIIFRHRCKKRGLTFLMLFLWSINHFSMILAYALLRRAPYDYCFHALLHRRLLYFEFYFAMIDFSCTADILGLHFIEMYRTFSDENGLINYDAVIAKSTQNMAFYAISHNRRGAMLLFDFYAFDWLGWPWFLLLVYY